VSVAALAAALALPAAGHAAPPWSPPQSVPAPTAAAVLRPSLDFGRGSGGVLGWSTSPEPFRLDVQRTGRLVDLRDGAPTAGPANLAPYDLAAPVQAYAATRTVALLERNAPRTRRDATFTTPQRLAVVFGSTNGMLGPPHVLAGSVAPRVSDADLAVNDRGDAVAVWVQAKGFRSFTALNDRLWISVRRAGGAFSRPTVLVGSGRLESVDAAVGANGDVLIAFTRAPIAGGRERRPRTVSVRYRRAGHRFGRIQAIGPNQGFADMAAAVAPNGRGYVAWGTQDPGEEADEPFRVYAAVKPAGATRFGRAALLDGGGGGLQRPIGNVSIGVAANADATVAWSGVRMQRTPMLRVFFPVLAASTGRGAVFGPAQPVAAGNGALGGVAVSPAGVATVVWTAMRPGFFDQPTGVLAAQRAPGGAAFGAAETITDQPPGLNDFPPAVTIDPATGGPVAAFTGRPGLFVSARAG
jgi:hypothetical protein